ncbi:40760_t:CDS:2, partial [Gigaspora margarita]
MPPGIIGTISLSEIANGNLKVQILRRDGRLTKQKTISSSRCPNHSSSMKRILQKCQNASNKDQTELEEHSAHALRHFTFEQSTPDIK